MMTMTVHLCDFNHTPRKSVKEIISIMTIPYGGNTVQMTDILGHHHQFTMDGSAAKHLDIDWVETE
jgi:hypothetical protein